MSNQAATRKPSKQSGKDKNDSQNASRQSTQPVQESLTPNPDAHLSSAQLVAKETANKHELAKKHTLFSAPEALKVQSFVDAKDQVNNWCVAYVIEENLDNNTVKLHFEGWSQRFEIVLKRNSNKMAPFRSHTRGYTG